MSKQIFIEVALSKEGEKTYVDWNKEFTSINEVVVALQIAMGAVMQEQQKQVSMQHGQVIKPPFIKRGLN
jgi:hypothetical protein